MKLDTGKSKIAPAIGLWGHWTKVEVEPMQTSSGRDYEDLSVEEIRQEMRRIAYETYQLTADGAIEKIRSRRFNPTTPTARSLMVLSDLLIAKS